MERYFEGWEPRTHHYYGDIVRRLFIAVAVIMAVGLPLFMDKVPMPAFISILVILAIGFAAGLTNPKQTWTTIADFSMAILGLVFFEFLSIESYREENGMTLYFFYNQGITVLFFFALYYASKTLRAIYLGSGFKFWK